MRNIPETQPIGRLARLLLGLILLGAAGLLLGQGSPSLRLSALAVTIALLLVYLLAHLMIHRFAPDINPWAGAVIANLPAGLVFALGLPGGWIFGQGEGFLGAALYVGVSLLLAALRADPGCEVMTLPALIFRRHTKLACLLFSPIDALEKRAQDG